MARVVSPAAAALMVRGVSLIQIGRRLGRTQATVSRYLSGELSPPPDLLAAIRLVAGPEAEAEVAAALKLSRQNAKNPGVLPTDPRVQEEVE